MKRAFATLVMISLLAAAPSGSAQIPQFPTPGNPPVGCVSPVTYGAIPNDGRDDREAFQQAVNIAGNSPLNNRIVCIPSGVWDIARRVGGGVVNIPSIAVSGISKLVITGVGPATRLRMLGRGYQADWRLIDIRDGSSNIVVRDMTLDGTRRTDTEEQTHLLHITGPASNITAQGIAFDFPEMGPSSGGDCVRLAGGEGTPVKGVTLRNLVGYRCDRSFIGFQRGVYKVLVDNVASLVVGDQAVDFEPTGGVDLGGVTIMNSRFARGPQSQGGHTVAIGGDGSFTAKGIELINTLIFDGGVNIIDAEGVLIQNVGIQGKPDTAIPVVDIRKRAAGVRIVDTTVVRPAGPVAANVLSVHHQSGVIPNDITLERVLLEQHTAAPIASIESLPQFTMRNSTLRYFGPPGEVMAITGRGVIASLGYVELRDNIVEGAFEGLLRLGVLSPSFPIGQVIVTGNWAPELTTYGVRFEDGLPSVPPIIENNNFGSAQPVQP